MDSKYLLDTNIFITAYRSTYPIDIFPSFWDQLISKGSSSIVLLDKVFEELSKGDDPLLDWVKKNKSNFNNVKCDDPGTISNYTEIADFLQNKSGYKDSAISEYFSVADSWICASAKANDFIVVTNELASNSKNRIKIPDVCNEFNINYINTVEFIRKIEIRL